MVRRRRRILAFAWVVAIAVAGGAGAVSLALFTREGPVEVPFTVGTISLGLAPAGTLITFSGMVPGDAVAGPLEIANGGTGALRYSMTSEATDLDGKHLLDVLMLAVERRSGCDGAVLETIYSGPIGLAAFGDPAPGLDPGDRALGSGSSEVLCLSAMLPVGTDFLYGGAASTATLTFWAEQTAGNP